MFSNYDVIVAGAGHAGCEAAHAAAIMGSKVLIITMNMQTIAQMSCNPAMGGIAKGQIVREIDALGGCSGIITDESLLQFRMLNKSKGPAMWSPRAQSDRALFSEKWRQQLERNSRVDFYQDTVIEIIINANKVTGVLTALGHTIYASSVILTSGTFLNGIIHVGEKQFGGGRTAEKAVKGLTEQLNNIGFISSRLKTGTPPRVDGRSLDYSKMDKQKGDEEITGFSFLPTHKIKAEQQLNCHITYTNENVHETLKTGFSKSPMFNGRIEGIGPRYCPSIEDKINRFAERDRHQIFVEPEGFNTVEIYVNGFSTSLSEDVQHKALQLIPGFKNVKMFRPGYAIEYDYFPPTQLKSTLETKLIKNLFFAGQINGTTGYEEAACQGLMAGINAHLLVYNKDPFILKREEAYIGVLIDDLVNKGTEEPYRMFTSRAEYRTLLRQDNADLRLTEKAYKIGLASNYRYESLQKKLEEIEKTKAITENYSVEPEVINEYLKEKGSVNLKEKQRLSKFILRPDVSLFELAEQDNELNYLLQDINNQSVEEAEIQIKYKRYIEKEKQMAAKVALMENTFIPENFDFDRVHALSSESKQKLRKIQPKTLGQAGRISGVNPSDVQILMVYMGR